MPTRLSTTAAWLESTRHHPAPVAAATPYGALRSARAAACRLSSALASDFLWTSSGPSAKRSVPDAGDGRGEREVLAEAAAAVGLDGLVEDPLHGRRGGDLDGLDLGVGALLPTVS